MATEKQIEAATAALHAQWDKQGTNSPELIARVAIDAAAKAEPVFELSLVEQDCLSGNVGTYKKDDVIRELRGALDRALSVLRRVPTKPDDYSQEQVERALGMFPRDVRKIIVDDEVRAALAAAGVQPEPVAHQTRVPAHDPATGERILMSTDAAEKRIAELEAELCDARGVIHQIAKSLNAVEYGDSISQYSQADDADLIETARQGSVALRELAEYEQRIASLEAQLAQSSGAGREVTYSEIEQVFTDMGLAGMRGWEAWRRALTKFLAARQAPEPSEREQEACAALRSLASYVGNGGYNAPNPSDIDDFHAKIKDGIDRECDFWRKKSETMRFPASAAPEPVEAAFERAVLDKVNATLEGAVRRQEMRQMDAAPEPSNAGVCEWSGSDYDAAREAEDKAMWVEDGRAALDAVQPKLRAAYNAGRADAQREVDTLRKANSDLASAAIVPAGKVLVNVLSNIETQALQDAEASCRRKWHVDLSNVLQIVYRRLPATAPAALARGKESGRE